MCEQAHLVCFACAEDLDADYEPKSKSKPPKKKRLRTLNDVAPGLEHEFATQPQPRRDDEEQTPDPSENGQEQTPDPAENGEEGDHSDAGAGTGEDDEDEEMTGARSELEQTEEREDDQDGDGQAGPAVREGCPSCGEPLLESFVPARSEPNHQRASVRTLTSSDAGLSLTLFAYAASTARTSPLDASGQVSSARCLTTSRPCAGTFCAHPSLSADAETSGSANSALSPAPKPTKAATLAVRRARTRSTCSATVRLQPSRVRGTASGSAGRGATSKRTRTSATRSSEYRFLLPRTPEHKC